MKPVRTALKQTTPLSDDGLLAYARAICGVRVGSECLPPDIEREAIEAFRKMRHHLDYLCGKPAFAREMAEEYHRQRGANVRITR